MNVTSDSLTPADLAPDTSNPAKPSAARLTPAALTRAAGVAAIAAGAIFIGVQVNHPHLDVDSVATTEVVVRNSLKVVMAVLALAGISGMYLSQIRRNGVTGLIGYLLLASGYLLISFTTFAGAFVLPAIASSDPSYVADYVEALTGGSASDALGPMGMIIQLQGVAYLVGGLILGIALFRAAVLSRWAAALLAVGGVVTVLLSVMPDAFYRLLALPNGVAMIALGWSLWRTQSLR